MTPITIPLYNILSLMLYSSLVNPLNYSLNPFKMQIEQSTLYTLIQWPEVQDLMDEPWFQEETSLADSDKFGNSAYFVPMTRWLEYANKTIQQVKTLFPEFTNDDNL